MFSRETLLEILEAPNPARRDMTVTEAAAHFGRSPSTVRSWLTQGLLRGYRLRGKAWRVPVAAIGEFEAREREGTRPDTRSREPADLGAWRREASA